MRGIREFIREEDGVGVVELILILVVLIGLVLIFKDQLTSLVNDIFDTITKKRRKGLRMRKRKQVLRYFPHLRLRWWHPSLWLFWRREGCTRYRRMQI